MAPVFPGDVILGDGDGVIVDRRASGGRRSRTKRLEMTAFEDFVVADAGAGMGRGIFGLYPAAGRADAEGILPARRKKTER